MDTSAHEPLTAGARLAVELEVDPQRRIIVRISTDDERREYRGPRGQSLVRRQRDDIAGEIATDGNPGTSSRVHWRGRGVKGAGPVSDCTGG